MMTISLEGYDLRKFLDAKRELYALWNNHFNGLICAYCSTNISKKSEFKDSKATVDHIIPRSLGGSSKMGNLVLSCQKCNEAKQSQNILPKYRNVFKNGKWIIIEAKSE